MSNLFNKNNLRDIFAELNSETNVPLPEYVNIKNITTSDNTSSFLPQKGGSFSITSANKNTDDQVNQLISMLTSESDDKHNFSANSTATDVLENRLRNMLQDGGAKKKQKKQRGGGDNELKECCDKLKAAGISVKLNDKTCSEYFGEKTEASVLSDLFLAPTNNSVKPPSASPRQPSVPSLNNETSSAMPNTLSPFLASPTSTQTGSIKQASVRQTATTSAMPNNMSSFLASPTSTQNGSVRQPSVRQPSVRPTMTTSSEMPENMSVFLASPTSTQGSVNPLFNQYQPPAPSVQPNLLDSAVSATVETVQNVTEGTTSFVGDLVNNVVETVKGSVKAVVETVDKILEDTPSPSPSSENKSPKLTGGGSVTKSHKLDSKNPGKKRKGSKKSSKKASKKGSRKGSKKGSKKMTGGGKKKSKKSSKKASKKGSKKSSKKGSRKGSKKGSRKGSKKMTGGGKKKSKKASKKGSKKLNGGANAGFEAFLKLKKAVAEELGVSNGPAAGKAAGAAQREVKADHPDWDAVKVSEEALKLVKANPAKYKEMA